MRSGYATMPARFWPAWLPSGEERREMKMKAKRNYLDLVPERMPGLDWKAGEDGMIVLLQEHRGVYHWIAQKLLKKPRVSRITLEKFGSFIWTRIDGTSSVGEIAQMVSAKFGEEAEPLYQRLVTYFRILKNNRFIRFR